MPLQLVQVELERRVPSIWRHTGVRCVYLFRICTKGCKEFIVFLSVLGGISVVCRLCVQMAP